MLTGEPSETAWAAAAHRAVHQVLERGRIFADPLALRLVGSEAARLVEEATERPTSRRMRIFVAVRARFAEDALNRAVARGASQVVVLGAGLDTFAYRNSFANSLRIFEVDHPATQAWKRDLLNRAEIPIPSALTFAPIDFERQTLAQGLDAAGFDGRRQTFSPGSVWFHILPRPPSFPRFVSLRAFPPVHTLFSITATLPKRYRRKHARTTMLARSAWPEWARH